MTTAQSGSSVLAWALVPELQRGRRLSGSAARGFSVEAVGHGGSPRSCRPGGPRHPHLIARRCHQLTGCRHTASGSSRPAGVNSVGFVSFSQPLENFGWLLYCIFLIRYIVFKFVFLMCYHNQLVFDSYCLSYNFNNTI